jgi:hypothetical protein
MLAKGRVVQALERELDDLLHAAHEADAALDRYRRALEVLRTMTSADLADRLGGTPWPGARPTADMDFHGAIVPFGLSWANAEEARAWAFDRLHGVATAAVDGSQIPASKEFGIPLSLVQIGWFRNQHISGAPYVKDVRDIVLAPDPGEMEAAEYASAESRVNRTRFTAEMDAACEQVQALAGSSPPGVVFVDGTLVLSFAGRLPAGARTPYLQSLFRLLDVSRECGVPVVGYVDSSRAADLVTSMRTAFDPDLPVAPLFDGSVLRAAMQPFDRTAAFATARGDILPLYATESHDYRQDLAFVYLQVGHNSLPARLDLPRWVLDDGLLDHIVDVVRAEILVGSGYPYALETADVTALLDTQDRLAFYDMVARFAREHGLVVTMPGKTASKARRR